MIHPLDWSLKSIYNRLKYGHQQLLNAHDIEAYLSLNVRDKVVLDVGAYSGDTARLFLDHGAKHVHCIEILKEFANKIKLPNVTVYNEPFRLKHLELPHDVMKMDIEGYEIELLNFNGVLKPSVVEVHSCYLIDKFLEKGWRIFGRSGNGLALMVNKKTSKKEVVFLIK